MDFSHQSIILKRSHHFVVKNPTRAIMPVVYRLSSAYTQFGMEFDDRTKRRHWRPLKTFAIYVDGGREFRFHIGQYDEFMRMLHDAHVDQSSYEIVEEPDYVADDIEIERTDGWDLYPSQKEAEAFVLEPGRDNASSMIEIQMGSGKAQPLTSLVKVPGGWKQMGHIKLWDIVTARDGTSTVVNGIFPKGQLPIYKITFEDGRSTECCLDHLWKVHSHVFSGGGHRIIKTLEIARLLKLPTYNNRLYIDLPLSEESNDIDLPIDPYLLGILLGDGTIGKRGVFLSSPDREILDYVEQAISPNLKLKHTGNYDYYISSGRKHTNENWLFAKLKALDLGGKRSWEKHIPDIYLNASHTQRLALLQGLMDTDGTAGKRIVKENGMSSGTISFCSTSLALAEGVQYLVRSLGGLAKIAEKTPFFTYKGERKQGRLAYIVNIRYKNSKELFRLLKKKERVDEKNQYSDTLKLRIRSLEFVGHKEAQCISVAHPEHLYITDDFIVTHNTKIACSAVSKIGKRFAVMVIGGYTDKWVADISSNLKIDKSEIAVIKGSDSLQRCTNYPGSGLTIPKAFVISINTMSKWYKLYAESQNHPQLEAYACMPYDFFEHLGIGAVIFDEVHQHLHAVYRAFCYMHVPKSISLSATLLSKDPTISKVQSMMFPHFKRFDKMELRRYVTCHACAYQISNFATTGIQTTEWGQQTYSHVAFERSLLSKKGRHLGEQYMKMISDLVQVAYIEPKVDGDKLAIFVSSKDMAEKLVEHLRGLYPSLDIRTYLMENEYKDVIEPDIRVTTILSAGTAIDIPNLRVSIMTISIDSPVANLQTFGRLREMKHRTEDNDVHFYYLYCTTIPKHVEYHENKLKLLANRVVEQKREFIGTIYPR